MTPETFRAPSRAGVAGGFQGRGRCFGPTPHPHPHLLPPRWLQEAAGSGRCAQQSCDFGGAAHARPRQRAPLSTRPQQRGPHPHPRPRPAESQEQDALATSKWQGCLCPSPAIPAVGLREQSCEQHGALGAQPPPPSNSLGAGAPPRCVKKAGPPPQ